MLNNAEFVNELKNGTKALMLRLQNNNDGLIDETIVKHNQGWSDSAVTLAFFGALILPFIIDLLHNLNDELEVRRIQANRERIGVREQIINNQVRNFANPNNEQNHDLHRI